jgi:DNA-binding NarL/FixJ family response regulator
MTTRDGDTGQAAHLAAARPDQQGFATLTRREREVLGGLVGGLRPADIARRDFVSVVTVRNQVQAILTKLNVHSQLEAVAAVRWSGWSWIAEDDEAGLPIAAFDASAS